MRVAKKVLSIELRVIKGGTSKSSSNSYCLAMTCGRSKERWMKYRNNSNSGDVDRKRYVTDEEEDGIFLIGLVDLSLSIK